MGVYGTVTEGRSTRGVASSMKHTNVQPPLVYDDAGNVEKVITIDGKRYSTVIPPESINIVVDGIVYYPSPAPNPSTR